MLAGTVMKKYCYILILLLAIFACKDAEQLLMPLIPDGESVPAGMVLIPAGEVKIGAPPGDVRPQILAIGIEKGLIVPEQTVFVDDFYIDTHEVTVAEFQAFVDAVGDVASQYSWNWYAGSTPQHPVFASYEAAAAYAEWAGKRLPTDAEWEKAARGGLVGNQTYPWGNEEPTTDHAHITPENASRPEKPYTVPVGSYPPNGYGLYDMAGNVGEWCYAEPDAERAPTRGGSWYFGKWYTRVYVRENLFKVMHATTTGFRCVKDVN